MFKHEPLCERCWFDNTPHPPLDTVKVVTPESCHRCGKPTVAGIFVRVEEGTARTDNGGRAPNVDPHEPHSPEFTAGREQGLHEGYDDGFAAGYDACLRDNGLAPEVERPSPIRNVVESL